MNQRQDNTDSKLEQAMYLLENQKWSVIPVGLDKKPLLDWKKYQTRRPAKIKIIEWFSNNSSANIAVITGKISNLVVVDIDPRHGGSDELFKTIETVKVITGGGGWHYYFLYEKGLKNRTGIRPGIDIRAEGGFVIVPPSSHSSGNKYKWIIEPRNQNPIEPLPAFVKDWINKPEEKIYNSNWDKGVLSGVNEGSRNNSAASVTGKILSRFAQDEWESDAWPLLLGWNTKNKPPLSEKELRSVFNSIANSEAKKNNTETETIKSAKSDSSDYVLDLPGVVDVLDDGKNLV